MVLRDGDGRCCLKNGDFQSCFIQKDGEGTVVSTSIFRLEGTRGLLLESGTLPAMVQSEHDPFACGLRRQTVACPERACSLRQANENSDPQLV